MQGIQSRAVRFALSCALCASACSTGVSSGGPPDSDVPALAHPKPGEQDSLLYATFAASEELGRTRESVFARLGRPQRTLETPVENVHVAGRTDTVVSMRYERLSVGFWVSGAGTEEEILFDVSMLPPWPLAVDVPQSAGRADLVERWGQPAFVHFV